MKGLLQRVRRRASRGSGGGETVGAIDQGLLVLVAVEPDDTRASADKLLHKLLNYRVFSDAEGKMNLSLADVGGGLLLVSQFTLAADTRSGLRPSFSTAAPPALGEELVRLSIRQSETGAWHCGIR
jgi:D-tyrosyl-tRNA(Tyr) deacylase